MRQVNRKNCGTLPDFGNFYEYDRYQGVQDLMPFAKGVSAKTHEFDAQGGLGLDDNCGQHILRVTHLAYGDDIA